MSEHKVTFTYLNIRQSIVILLAKLILIDIVLAIIVVGFYFLMVQGEKILFIEIGSNDAMLFLSLFGLIGFIKITLTIYTILQWLNEYYEITPDTIVHKKGIIFRKTQLYDLDKIRAMDVQDTLWGELFNVATITLYDIRLNKYLDMYLIHNPQRYSHVLKELRPSIEIKEDSVRLPFLHKKELVREYE